MPKKVRAKRIVETPASTPQASSALFASCLLTLAVVPLLFSTAVYRIFVLPKFAALLLGATAALVLTALTLVGSARRDLLGWLRSKHVLLVCLYVGAIAIATIFGVSPLSSLLGSNPIQMGLITRLCYLAVFIGLVIAIGRSGERLTLALWTMALTGLAAAAYACLQFFGKDPFLPADLYTFASPGGPVVRVPGPLGHSNYLGNYLLYTTPLSAGLAFASHGRARRIAAAGTALSLAAIAFSGTRGAWLGVFVGAAIFAFLEVKRAKIRGAASNRRIMAGAAIALAFLLVAVATIAVSPASRSIVTRARSFVTEGFTGAGRTLLWRDSASMARHYALTGCGPEGFSKAFLAYKSAELGRYAPQINNESPHNSYLDAAVSFGLPGAVLYAAIIASAFALLLRSRRRVQGQAQRFVITGLISSLTGVSVHNFFIYDQVPTGLYFFAFMALASIVSNVTAPIDGTNKEGGAAAVHRSTLYGPVAAAGVVLLLAAGWYTASLGRADVAIRHAFVSANAQDFDGLVSNGARAAQAPDPTRAYNFLFARALALYVDSVPRGSRRQPALDTGDRAELRAQAIDMALWQAKSSLAHTLAPESNYSLLAYLALARGDSASLREFAGEAVKWDPNFANARWLMGEALLSEGDREGAMREAQLALDLYPASTEARSVLARARGEKVSAAAKVSRLVERARKRAKRGNTSRAIELLDRAIQRSAGPCPSCHRELALLYERINRNGDAISEWQIFAIEDPRKAAELEVASRIERLR